jgi:phosphopantetheinyl transferase
MTVFGCILGSSEDDRSASRIALQAACQQLHISEAEISYRPTGQPYLVNHPGLFCSIAHSMGWGIAGVYHTPIGVDIEKVQERDARFFSHITSDSERSYIESALKHIPIAEQVVRTWTIKEAVLKAVGVGLHLSPRKVVITKLGAHFEALIEDIRYDTYWYGRVEKHQEMIIAIATQESTSDHVISWITPDFISAQQEKT